MVLMRVIHDAVLAGWQCRLDVHARQASVAKVVFDTPRREDRHTEPCLRRAPDRIGSVEGERACGYDVMSSEPQVDTPSRIGALFPQDLGLPRQLSRFESGGLR